MWPQSDAVKKAIPALAYLASLIGDPAVRYRGTIGGSLANNDPAADYPAAVLALGATIKTNKRTIAADEFFKGLFSTALRGRRNHHRRLVPGAGQGGLLKIPASGFAFCADRGVRRKDPVRRCSRGGDRCIENGVMRVPAIEAALKANWSAGALDSVKISADGLLSDLHGSAVIAPT